MGNDLEGAIVDLAVELTMQQSLTAQAGDAAWWKCQAISLGISHLKSLVSSGATDPVRANQVRQSYRQELQVVSATVSATPAPVTSKPLSV